MSSYGTCECGYELVPVWFEEEEYKESWGWMLKTGRTRMSVSHLSCHNCLKNHCVDDSFDKPWK